MIFLNLYLGFKKAIWKGYFPILRVLYKKLKKMMKLDSKIGEEIMISINSLKFDYLLNVISIQPEMSLKKLEKLSSNLSQSQKKISNISIERIKQNFSESKKKKILKEMNKNMFYLIGKTLPKNKISGNFVSIFSKKNIQVD